MKYKAKYLPVEGEIKQGNKYFASDGTLCERYASKDVEGDKLAKLFLISTDIKVGDKFQSFSGMCELEWDGKFQLHPEDYKVIGEISPEALSYVKEGDEFDEDDWKLCGRTEGVPGLSYNLLKGEQYRQGYLKFYETLVCQVKCPTCNTFH